MTASSVSYTDGGHDDDMQSSLSTGECVYMTQLLPKFFSPPGRIITLVFPYQTLWHWTETP